MQGGSIPLRGFAPQRPGIQHFHDMKEIICAIMDAPDGTLHAKNRDAAISHATASSLPEPMHCAIPRRIV